MKKLGILVMAVIVLAVGLWYYQDLQDWSGSPIYLAEGWNTVTIPDSWDKTTAKGIIDHSSQVSVVSVLDDNGEWATYGSVYPESYNFAILPGMEVWIYANEPTVALGG